MVPTDDEIARERLAAAHLMSDDDPEKKDKKTIGGS